MKKFIIFLAILIIPAAAYSQFDAGIEIGYNATMLSSDWDDINSSLKSGFQFGVFVRLGDKFFIQPELLYASRKGYAGFQSEAISTDNEIHTGVFQLPVMAGLKVIDGEALSLNVQAGPVMTVIADKGIGGASDVFTEESFNDAAWGIQAGAGLDFLSFALNIRYEYALSEIYSGKVNNQNISIKANTFLVTLGWKLL